MKDPLIEALFQALLSEEDKPLSVRHRQVKHRILEAEAAVRKWTKPKLSDPGNERVHLQFRDRLRQHVERGVARLVGIECGVVSGVINLESSGVEAPDWRPRHDEHYHEA
jgi:hypothetical protein